MRGNSAQLYSLKCENFGCDERTKADSEERKHRDSPSKPKKDYTTIRLPIGNFLVQTIANDTKSKSENRSVENSLESRCRF
jgi:hypothetical protein